ncbi:MAG: hypothetical protein DHS20C06_09140 [Hyphobacterium sp.]|nr:MAG: hypothetical protein DHS20C06_09140 [Hyphobacterium sp.]
MTLSIKDPETDALARQLAELSGLSITDAVREALEMEIARRAAANENDTNARLAKLNRLLESFPKDLFKDMTSGDHDFLYGEDGLPE